MAERLTFLTWFWGNKYSPNHVFYLRQGLIRHVEAKGYWLDFKVVVTPDKEHLFPETMVILNHDKQLIKIRDGCYTRLQMFDPLWQEENKIERLVCLDLDMVITRPYMHLFDTKSKFKILHGGHFNPCPYNGSVMMLKAGEHSELWSRFDIDEAHQIAFADGTDRGTDQTWIAAKAPNAEGWTWRDGIYAFQKPGWPIGESLPPDACIVAFPGRRDPSQLLHLTWVKESWR